MSALSSLLAKAARQAARVALRVTPTTHMVAVYGFADDEENSLRVAAAAAAALPDGWRTVLLCDDPVHARTLLATASGHASYPVAAPAVVRKDSLRGLAAFVRARGFFFTHPIFGAPQPGRRRLFVNVGHGHGPKAPDHKGMSGRHPADVALVNNARWGGDVITVRGLAPGGQMAVLSNPREDALVEGGDRGRLADLGIDPGRPLVAWLPTYRQSITMRTASWRDGTPIDEDDAATAALSRMREIAERAGVTLVTKFHKMDGQSRASVTYGVPVVTQQDLDDADLSFYQFLSLTDGLVSDYSSVYVDYLTADRNVGLFFHDADAFVETRGFNQPDFRDAAADLILRDEGDMQGFFDAVSRHEQWRRPARRHLASAIGLARHEYSATLALLRCASLHAERKGVDLPLVMAPSRGTASLATVGGVQ